MFTLFGWADVSTSAYEGDVEEQKSVVDWLLEKISELRLDERADVKTTNGSSILRLALVLNHESGYLERCRAMLTELGERAPGSYGVFYARDCDFEEPFVRLVMRRGKLEEVSDDLFSPAVPRIEDP